VLNRRKDPRRSSVLGAGAWVSMACLRVVCSVLLYRVGAP